MIMSLSALSQVGIGTSDPKSALDIVSTTSGILIPRMTGEQISSIQKTADNNGMLVYATSSFSDITGIGFWYYDHLSNGWSTMASGDGGSTSTSTTIFTESNGTEITVSGTTEEIILTESLALTSNSKVEINGLMNVKSTDQSIVPELRLEVKDSGGTTVFEKIVRKGMITTPTVELQDDLDIYGLADLTSGSYTINLYASQPACCNVDGLSFITNGTDTKSHLKIITTL